MVSNCFWYRIIVKINRMDCLWIHRNYLISFLLDHWFSPCFDWCSRLSRDIFNLCFLDVLSPAFNYYRNGLIASGGVTSMFCSRADNDCPTNEPPATTAAKQPSPSRIATTIRVSSVPSTFGWRDVVAITMSRRPLFWLISLRNFNLQPDLYGSSSTKSPCLGMAPTFHC